MENSIKFQNNKLKLVSLLIIFLMLVNTSLTAQSKKMVRAADIHYHASEFNQALPLYLTLLGNNPTSFLYNYRTGMCYMNSNVETGKCVKYFETAKANMDIAKDSTPDFYYYLGHAYQIVNKFESAIKNLSLSKSMLSMADDSLNIFFINSEIEQCKFGKKSIESPANAKLVNLGGGVNSKYPDYSPVILPSEDVLFFTTTRKGSTSDKFHKQDEYYEDIYVSKNIWNDTLENLDIESTYYQPDISRVHFDTAVNAGFLVNTKSHDASISSTPDGDTLYMFRLNSVWKSSVKNGELSRPQKVNYVVNGRMIHKSSLTKTLDGKVIYFVSDQRGGLGGKDIYRSFKQADGTWGPEENLGPRINTSLDEEAPFFDSNEGVLYFSSQGHNNMGGFDVFRTKFEDYVWSKPENLGYPINSGTDDVFYSINTKRNRGYISTMRAGGEGNYDIYMVRFTKPLEVLFATTYSGGLKPIDTLATIYSIKTGDSVRLSSNKSGIVKYKSGGNFKMTVPRYDTDSVNNTFEYKTPNSYGDYTYYQEINYEAITNHKKQLIGYKTVLYNAFFDIKKKAGKKDAFAAYVKSITSENEYFQVTEKIDYVDTLIYQIYTETMTSRALAAGNTDPIKVPLTPQEARDLLANWGTIATVTPAPKVEVQVRKVEETVSSSPAVVKTKAKVALVSAAKEEKKVAGPTPSALDPILFAFSRNSLGTVGKAQFEILYTYMKDNNNISIKITGYTDNEGTDKLNDRLAVKRAIEIKLLLIERGIAKNRMKAMGKGATNPVAPNKKSDNSDNEEGRKLNRRVEFEIIK